MEQDTQLPECLDVSSYSSWKTHLHLIKLHYFVTLLCPFCLYCESVSQEYCNDSAKAGHFVSKNYSLSSLL